MDTQNLKAGWKYFRISSLFIKCMVMLTIKIKLSIWLSLYSYFFFTLSTKFGHHNIKVSYY